MNQSADNSHYVKRVVLPSGRAIEVVYFDTSEPAHAKAPGTRDLHSCPECEHDLVYPVEWEETSPTRWQVLLRCPDCEWSELDTFDQETVDRFDLELDRGTEHLIRELKRLVQVNMEDEVERFAKALRFDAIWPMDFPPATHFANSAPVAHPHLLALGDVIPVPGPWPLGNVISIGDILIITGLLTVLHHASRRVAWRARRPA